MKVNPTQVWTILSYASTTPKNHFKRRPTSNNTLSVIPISFPASQAARTYDVALTEKKIARAEAPGDNPTVQSRRPCPATQAPPFLIRRQDFFLVLKLFHLIKNECTIDFGLSTRKAMTIAFAPLVGAIVVCSTPLLTQPLLSVIVCAILRWSSPRAFLLNVNCLVRYEKDYICLLTWGHIFTFSFSRRLFRIITHSAEGHRRMPMQIWSFLFS